tara:strand:- start:843 stop:1361 length:519 start_codon:yes stop_codon:yes gene_type:complete
MSTRSTLTIKTDTTAINFYRHMDGYVAEAGHTLVQLIDKVAANNSWQHPGVKLAEEIMKQQYEATKHRAAESIYELTNNPEGHSDREYHYELDYLSLDGSLGDLMITVYEWVYGKPDGTIFSGNFMDYKDFVTKEVEIMDQRRQAIDALHENKKNPIVIETNKSFRMRKVGV